MVAAVAGLAAITGSILAAGGVDQLPALETWLTRWPPASELAAQDVRECSGRRCRVRYVKATPERDWIVDTTFGLTIEVVRSALPRFAQRSQRDNLNSSE